MLKNTLLTTAIVLGLAVSVTEGVASGEQPQLKQLRLDQAQELDGNSDVTRLQLLGIGVNDCAKVDLRGVGALPVQELILDMLPNVDYEPLGQLKSLEKLTIFYWGLRRGGRELSQKIFCFLKDLANLKQIKLYSAPFDMQLLQGMRMLTRLDLNGCCLKDQNPLYLSVISRLPRLVSLSIEGPPKELTSLEELRGCRLQSLSIQAADITSIEPLEGMPLKYLSLEYCHYLIDVSPIADLRQLEILNLGTSGTTLGNHVGWHALDGHPSLRRINVRSSRELYGTDLAEISSYCLSGNLIDHAEFNPYRTNIQGEGGVAVMRTLSIIWNIFPVLISMPKLEAVFTETYKIPENVLQEVRWKRPNLWVTSRGPLDWHTAPIEELKK